MSKEDKTLEKIYKNPIANDITFNEAVNIMIHYGCILENGGKHPKIVHVGTGTVIPLPHHGKCIGEVYVKQLRLLLDEIREGNKV